MVASTTLSLFAVSDHTNSFIVPDLQGWVNTSFLITVVNVSAAIVGDLGPGQMLIHPMPSVASNTFNVIRWTAPATGNYNFGASWFRVSASGDGVDSHVVLNGVSIFDTIVGPASTVTESQMLNLTAGNTLDFVLGPGASGLNDDDSTIFNATITLVPEPSSVFLAAIAVPFLFRRQRNPK